MENAFKEKALSSWMHIMVWNQTGIQTTLHNVIHRGTEGRLQLLVVIDSLPLALKRQLVGWILPACVLPNFRECYIDSISLKLQLPHLGIKPISFSLTTNHNATTQRSYLS